MKQTLFLYLTALLFSIGLILSCKEEGTSPNTNEVNIPVMMEGKWALYAHNYKDRNGNTIDVFDTISIYINNPNIEIQHYSRSPVFQASYTTQQYNYSMQSRFPDTTTVYYQFKAGDLNDKMLSARTDLLISHLTNDSVRINVQFFSYLNNNLSKNECNYTGHRIN